MFKHTITWKEVFDEIVDHEIEIKIKEIRIIIFLFVLLV